MGIRTPALLLVQLFYFMPWFWGCSHRNCAWVSCDPMDYSLPGSSAHGILQARVLEWVAIPFSRRSSLFRNWTWVLCITGEFFTVWTRQQKPCSHRHLPLEQQNLSKCPLDQYCWHFNVHMRHLANLLTCKFWFSSSGTGLESLTSCKLPGDALTTGPWTTFWVRSSRHSSRYDLLERRNHLNHLYISCTLLWYCNSAQYRANISKYLLNERDRQSELLSSLFEFQLVLNAGSIHRSCVILCFEPWLHLYNTSMKIIPDLLGLLGNIKRNAVCRLRTQAVLSASLSSILAQWVSY